MILSLEEILHTCYDWEQFCRLHGFNEYAVNEGGGDVQVQLSENQAHHLGIVNLEDYMIEPFEDVYPNSE